MRIAVALSGQPRTWRHTIASLKRYFGEHEVEYFLHTWDEGDPSERAALVEAYGAKVIRIEPRPAFLDEKRRLAELFPEKPPLTVFDMFHSMAKSVQLAVEAHEGGGRFDLVCRSRFDMTYHDQWSAEAPEPGTITVPHGFDSIGGCSDQFALGAPSDLMAYAEVGRWLAQGLDQLQGPRFRPEVALRHYLEDVAGLTVRHEPLAVALLREGQVGRPFHALRDDPLFHAEKHEAWEAFARANFSPELLKAVDFKHASRLALKLDRDFAGWLERQTPAIREALLSAPWTKRILAVDAFLEGQAGRPTDAVTYLRVRYLCATLLHNMARDEPLGLEGFIVHALSANRLDAERCIWWANEKPSRLNGLPALLGRLGSLAAAFNFAEPLKQPTAVQWRNA